MRRAGRQWQIDEKCAACHWLTVRVATFGWPRGSNRRFTGKGTISPDTQPTGHLATEISRHRSTISVCTRHTISVDSKASNRSRKRSGARRGGGRGSSHASNLGGHRPTTSEKNASGPTVIFGLHAAQFALDNPARQINAVYVTQNAENKLTASIAARALPVAHVTPQQLDRRLGADTVHQGVLLEVEPLPVASLDDLAIRAHTTGQPVVVLDQVTDPQNVGAVLRSMAVFGAAGLILTYRHSPPLGATLAKSASGALDLVPIAQVQNLAKAIEALRAQALFIVGLDGELHHPLLEEQLIARSAATASQTDQRAGNRSAPLCLALGAEGSGLRELTRRSCDVLCRIGGDGPLHSLNVSNAAAIALHLAAIGRRRPG